MADLYQSSLFEPTAPPESLLHKHIRKKAPKVVSGQDSNAKEKTPVTSTPSHPGHTLAPFLNYFTKRRKINNNNNNNINNNSKFNHGHSLKTTETCGDGPHSKAESGGKRFNFLRGKQTSELHVLSSTKPPTASEQEQITQCQNSELGAENPGNLEPLARDEMEVEVVCHGLMTKTESFGKKCLLSHSGHETDSESELGAQKNIDQELGNLLVAVGKNSGQTRSDEDEVAPKYEKFVDTSEMQEQLNSINLKRCKDATMPQSLCPTTTLPAHSESLSIPPVIEEIEESNVEEPSVIEIFLPQRDPLVKESSSIELVQGLGGNPGSHNNVNKRRKLRHILRHFLSMNGSLAKEDKQRLVEDEEDDDEEEEQATVVTAIGGQESQGDKCQISKTPPTQNDTDTVASEKKRHLGTKGDCRGWGRRVRRSLGRGCHYLGLSVFNITNYIIAEATFMGPVSPNRNYDWDYIYNTNEYEYGVNDYMYS